MFDFDKHKKQERERRHLAHRQPVVEVTGIIPPHGASLAQLRGSPAEEVVIFHIWRVGAGPLEAEELRLVQEVGDSSPFGSLRGILPGTVIATQAGLVRANDGVFGVVAGPIEIVDPDMALVEALERKKAPSTFKDAHLGTLTADDLLGWVGQAEWLGENCNVSIDHLDDLTVAHALWADQRRWTTNAVNFATERLLGLKNDVWLGEDEAPLSPTAFGARLKLTSISIERRGAFVLDFDDGDLFWGHTIMVEGNLRDGIQQAEIAG